MNTAELKNRLLDELDTPAHMVDGIIAKVQAFQPETAAAFERWFTTGELDDTEVEGFTVAGLMKAKRVNPVTAFLWQDWLRRDPKTAQRALTQQEFVNSAARRVPHRSPDLQQE